MTRTCGGRCWRRIAYREEPRDLSRPQGCKKKATYLMRVPTTERPQESSDEQRAPLRRALVWGLIGVVVLVGILLYFRYERALAPLTSSQGS
jgi:hypothetical protein